MEESFLLTLRLILQEGVAGHENADSGTSWPSLGALLEASQKPPHIWARSRACWGAHRAGTRQEQAVGAGETEVGWGPEQGGEEGGQT